MSKYARPNLRDLFNNDLTVDKFGKIAGGDMNVTSNDDNNATLPSHTISLKGLHK